MDSFSFLSSQEISVTISEYLNEIPEPNKHWAKHEIDRAIYFKWALTKIQDLLIEHPEEDPEDLVYTFYIKSEYYKTLSDVRQANLMFEMSSEAAQTILGLIRKE